MLFELIRMFDLKVCRRDLTERTVPTTWVVPTFDVRKQCQPSLRAGLENLSIEQLTFKTGEETLCRRIVVGVANAAQGLA